MLTAVRPQFSSNVSDGCVADRVAYAQTQAVLDPIVIKQYVTLAAAAKVVFFIAETGYGKTFTCSQIDLALRSSRFDTYWVRFGDDVHSSDMCIANQIIEKSEAICNQLQRPAVLFIDNLLPLGGEATKAVVEVLNHLSDCGVALFITCRPELSHLLPYFPDALSVTAKHLTVPYGKYCEWGKTVGMLPSTDVTALTRGIPALLEELSRAQIKKEWDATFTCEIAHDALIGVVKRLLRRTLPLQEYCLRLALVLLGSGTFDDLCSLIPDLTFAQFANCARQAPFFGINQLARSFACTRICLDETFDSCAAGLPALCEETCVLAANAIGLLVKRRRYARAFVLARRYMPKEFCETFAFTYPIELIDAGYKNELFPVLGMKYGPMSGFEDGSTITFRTEEALPSDDKNDGSGGLGILVDSDTTEPVSPSEPACAFYHAELSCMLETCSKEFGYGIARIAIAAIDGELYAAEVLQSALPKPVSERERTMFEQVEWLVYALKVQSGALGWSESTPAYHAMDDLSSDIRTYALGMQSCLRGRFQHCFEMLLPYEHVGDKNSLVKHLIAGLFAFNRFIVGDTHNGATFVDCRREKWFIAHGFSRQLKVEELKNALIRYLKLCLVVRPSELHDFRPMMHELERSLSTARAKQLRLLEVGLYWCGAVLELRQGNYLRGCIHATNGLKRAQDAGAQQLAHKLEVVRELCTVGLGDRSDGSVAGVALDTKAVDAESLARWVLLMCAWDRADVLSSNERALAKAGLDQNDAFMLCALVDICPNHAVLESAMPKSWRQKLLLWSELAHEDQLLRYAKREELSPKGDPQKIEVHLLGEFCVLRKGVPIHESAWHRKKAKELVAILAAQPGHRVERQRLINLLWPGCNDEDGRSRLYVTLSAARQALGEKRGEARLIGGHGGQIWLSDELVTCDVDSLDRALIGAMSVQCEDGELVNHAIRVSDMYIGDMVPIDVDSLLIERRQRELRNKVTDVLIMGARAALRLKTPVRAYWLAERAVCVDELREDAHNTLIEALLAQGRDEEARKYYENYARIQVSLTGRPPSRSIRRAMKHYKVSGGRVVKGFGDTAPLYELEGLTSV